jgi:hypothetical protein
MFGRIQHLRQKSPQRHGRSVDDVVFVDAGTCEVEFFIGECLFDPLCRQRFGERQSRLRKKRARD